MKAPPRGQHIDLETYGTFQVIIGPNPDDDPPTIRGWVFSDDGKEWQALPMAEFKEKRIR